MRRGGQVLSKARFVSAQIERYLADDRWLERGRSANAHAAELVRRLAPLPGVEVVAPVETNVLFLRLPPRATDALASGPFRFYTLGRDQRFVCRSDQEPEGIEALARCVSDSLRVVTAPRR
jgi:threonine aldolase